YGHTIYGWARRLTPECGPRDASRLLQLVELAYRYDPEAGLRTRDFIERVRSEHVEAPTPADVRVMTIHKSKGLEFDIVVLPQLDVNLIGQTPPVLVGRPDAVAPIDFICRYPNESLRRLLPQKALDAYERYGKQVLRESLCVLYVALTRAIHALHVIVAPAKKNEKSLPATFAGLLRAALAGGVPADAETVLYEHGNPLWHEKLADSTKPRASAVETPRPAALKVAWAPTPKLRRRGLDRESPSARAHSAKVELATLMALDDGRAASRGSVFHAWFERIEWLDSTEPDGADLDEAAMRRIGARVGASPEDLAEWLAQFRAKLQNPGLRSVLSRGTYLTPRTAPWAGRPKIAGELAGGPPVLEVFRERPFAVRLRDTLLNGTFDRLVLARAQPAAAGKDGNQLRGGKLVAVEVLDFKTDALAPDDPKAIDKIVERYRPQLSAYREAVCGMFALPADRVMTRLVLLEADEVREVVDSHE
ncbi:MAG TPA: 3'-5' exonuclease, partial [Pirellulales bacterium]